jgi:hypothetical protein
LVPLVEDAPVPPDDPPPPQAAGARSRAASANVFKGICMSKFS